jgi:glycosyltransferase involved in cell wall biosynthesis
MRLLYIADGRSPIAQNWIGYFIQAGHEVHLISSFPCPSMVGLASFNIIPVAMSGIYGQPELGGGYRAKILRWVVPVHLRTCIRQLVAPISFSRAAQLIQERIEQIQPDLVHAMRIPFEGMVASMAGNHGERTSTSRKRPPLLLSVWGNDFTLHARSTTVMAYHNRRALQDCDALHTDCQRDLKLARELGFSLAKPSITVPAGGGVKSEVFYPPPGEKDVIQQVSAGNHPITIINPRGFRAYVRNDTFFRAIPLIIRQYPNARFQCIAMAGEVQAERWITELGIKNQVELLPRISQPEVAERFRQSQISVSITTHDGTPNTLIEAMACGCFPVAGDIESLREWITPGVNGTLVDPGDPDALAEAIIEVIANPDKRRQACEHNIKLVTEQVAYEKVMGKVENFYFQLIS